MPTIVELPFKLEGDDISYGSFDQHLVNWDACETSPEELEQMVRDSDHERGFIRFEDNQPVSIRGQ